MCVYVCTCAHKCRPDTRYHRGMPNSNTVCTKNNSSSSPPKLFPLGEYQMLLENNIMSESKDMLKGYWGYAKVTIIGLKKLPLARFWTIRTSERMMRVLYIYIYLYIPIYTYIHIEI